MARSKRNQFVAGLFILAAMVLLAVVFVAISNLQALAVEKTVYYVAFDEAPAIKVGSPVKLGGSAIGRITDLQLQWKTVPGQAEDVKSFYYLVALKVPAEIQLRRNARVVIDTAVVGDEGAVNIESIGTSELAVDTEGNPIHGSAGTMARIMRNLEDFSAQLKGEQTAGPAAEILANVRTATGEIKKVIPKIDKVTSDMVAITENLKTSVPELVAGAKEGVATIKSAGGEIEGILKENRENIKAGIADAAATIAGARKKIAELMANLVVTTGDFRALVAANRLNISDLILDLRTTSEQLKAASIEIRRAPWRLLYKPDQREADTLNIFDATANYARTVSDLRSAAATLQMLLDLKASGAPIDEKLVQNMMDRLKIGFQKYEEAEDALWKEWGEAEKK